MKCAIFLSVRNKATRLPNKHFLKIKGRTTIEHLIDRLKLACFQDMIVLCTSTNPDDDVLVDVAKKNSISYFRGSEEDKLARYLEAAKKFGIDFMVVVDGDDLFCDSVYIDKIIEAFKKTNADFIYCEGLPFGTASNGIKFSALQKVCETKKEKDTEVWGNYFLKNKNFKKVMLKASPELNYPQFRMSLDYREDFDFFSRVFEELGDKYGNKNIFPLIEIVNLLKKKPEIREINSKMHAAYEQNIRKKEVKVLMDIG